MRVHYLQHVPFEGLGSIEESLKKRGCTITRTRLYNSEELPPLSSFDWLIVMGGPMGVYDERDHPWLAPEKNFIRVAIEGGKTVLGICLGSQLIASVLGAKVHSDVAREIGWFPIIPANEAAQTPLRPVFSSRLNVLHWHSDSFAIPEGATLLASSEACENQAFIYGDRVVGLQFHMETTILSTSKLINHCGAEMIAGPYVQTADEIMAMQNRFHHAHQSMDSLISILHGKTETILT